VFVRKFAFAESGEGFVPPSTADFNLLIRTLVVAPGSIAFAAGGGITAASDPAAEYAESLAKAEGMLRVLDALGNGPRNDRQAAS
jgi:anthranilate/para-aminobenzoate synthase component I